MVCILLLYTVVAAFQKGMHLNVNLMYSKEEHLKIEPVKISTTPILKWRNQNRLILKESRYSDHMFLCKDDVANEFDLAQLLHTYKLVEKPDVRPETEKSQQCLAEIQAYNTHQWNVARKHVYSVSLLKKRESKCTSRLIAELTVRAKITLKGEYACWSTLR